MKKIIIFIFIGFNLCSCNVFTVFTERCRTEVTKTQNGNFVFCALCDSLTFKKIFPNDTIASR